MNRLLIIMLLASPVSAQPNLYYELDHHELQELLTETPADTDQDTVETLEEALADLKTYGGSFDPNVGLVTGHPDYETLADVYYARFNHEEAR